MLRRIRAAIGETPAADAAAIRAEWEALPRKYKRTATLEREAMLEMLEDRLRDYDAHGGAGEARARLRERLRRLLSGREKRQAGCARGLGRGAWARRCRRGSNL